MEVTVERPGYRMGWVGAQREVLAGDLSPRADLRQLAGRVHVNALGPLEALRGEVTIVDGAPFISTVANGAVAVERGLAHRACFLVFAEVPRWRWTVMDAPLPSLAALETVLGALPSASGVDPGEPFPFRITGTIDEGTIHVLDKRDGLPHNPERHEAAKVHFSLSREDAELIGFRSARHQGVFVPGASTMHIHLAARGGRLAGHVDALSLTRGWRLALPAAPGPEALP